MRSLFYFASIERSLFRFAQPRHRNYSQNAGWSSLVARQAHNLKAAGSNPAPATKFLPIAMAYRVYVIQNREGKFYIGLSVDVDRRIDQHNIGDSRWTRGKGPWILMWQSEEMNLSDARKLELLLKRQKGGDGFYRMIGASRFGS
jgi:putative endonuclease